MKESPAILLRAVKGLHMTVDTLVTVPERPDRLANRDKLEGGVRIVMETPFEPAGDQPTAIRELTEGVNSG